MNERAANTTSVALADDRGDGLAMFLIFAAAALIVTGAVALLALVGSWWMLGVAFAVHVAMTAVVTLTIVGAMNGRLDAIRGGPSGRPTGGSPTSGKLAVGPQQRLSARSIPGPRMRVNDRLPPLGWRPAASVSILEPGSR